MSWVWVGLGLAGILCFAIYALCAAAAAGDADLRRVVEQQAPPAAPVGDSLARLAPDLERLLALGAEMLGADLAAVAFERGGWSYRPAERRVRRRAAGSDPCDLVDGPQAAASAPIGPDGAVRGRLTVVATQPGRRFSGRELTLLGTLADACGAALDTTETQTPVALAAHVDALSGTLGAGRAELRWRGGDFVALAAAVGRRVRLEEAEQAELELAARLLDVGLLRVPGDVLDRPGPLSATEMRVVRRHPTWGAEALLHVPGLAAVAMLVLCHHERWDGRGYPHGLDEERIPLGARVLAACDAWWAMTSRRRYAAPLAPDEAAGELAAAGGHQLDPEVAGALLAEVAGVTLVA